MTSRNLIPLATLILSTAMSTTSLAADAAVQLITLDPGHFHASLVQKSMYPQVSPVVHVYAPTDGQDLQDHLNRIQSFNSRADNPTHWEEKVYTGPDFLKRMVQDKAGNLVVISGNNLRKTEYIDDSVRAGFNVLADKPMAITPEGFKLLRKTFDRAARNKVLLYDIMTERYEITSILERELARTPEVFGVMQKGSPSQPAVEMVSVHHFFKEVAGKPLTRPAWFFDVRQQGEAVPDVGTHVVDLIQWESFPDQTLDWKKDVKMLSARRWPTVLTPAQFKRATGLDSFPAYLKPDVGSDGNLNVFENGEAIYTLRGVHAKASVIWRFEAPPGTKDTHHSVLRGTRATLSIVQGPKENYVTTLYIQNTSGSSDTQFEAVLRAAVARLANTWPGLEVKRDDASWVVVIPDKYRVTHEGHFAQVTEKYLGFLAKGEMPAWEVPNMIAKYYTTTEAYRLSHAKK